MGDKRQKMTSRQNVNFKLKGIEEPRKNQKDGEVIVINSDFEEEAKSKKKHQKYNYKKILGRLGIEPEKAFNFEEQQPVRKSRRVAQLKIVKESERKKIKEVERQLIEKAKITKESERKKIEEVERRLMEKARIMKESERKKKVGRQLTEKGEKKKTLKKSKERTFSSDLEKHKQKYRKCCELNRWTSSSSEEEEMEEEAEEEEDEDVLQDVSDHEFSPEIDMDGDGEGFPLKMARTACQESAAEEIGDFFCRKCGKSNQPEWILLCNRCDDGWHCSCLRRPLSVIPEGDWFCPVCQHATLLRKLEAKLKSYDHMIKRKEIQRRRKERLAYVTISSENVLPNSKSRLETESDAEEPTYKLRQRRVHCYRYDDYDKSIFSPIVEESDAVKDARDQLNTEEERKNESDTEILPSKKRRKSSAASDVTSEDEDSDEDFVGTSSESD